MKGVTFAILVCTLISWHAAAQNRVSQGLLELSEDERNETFTRLVQDHHAKCDKVIRTVFSGTTVELDDCEVLCRDRNSYSLSIPPEPNADIDVLDPVAEPSNWRNGIDFRRRHRRESLRGGPS